MLTLKRVLLLAVAALMFTQISCSTEKEQYQRGYGEGYYRQDRGFDSQYDRNYYRGYDRDGYYRGERGYVPNYSGDRGTSGGTYRGGVRSYQGGGR